MDRLLSIILLLLFSLIIISCGNNVTHRNYRFAKDGLIYNYHNDELYNGVITDTANVIIEFDVLNGKKNGRFTTYYLDGKIEKTGLLKDDKNIGEWRYYYSSGQIESLGNFEKNNPQGRWVFYFPGGSIKAAGNYSNGKQHGRWLYYNEEKEVIHTLFYSDGKLIEVQNNLT